jgi:hypothetical protein
MFDKTRKKKSLLVGVFHPGPSCSTSVPSSHREQRCVPAQHCEVATMMATSELPASSSNADALLVSDSNSIRFERPFIGLCIQILMATFWLGLICSFILSPLVILGCELGDDWHPILDMPKNSVVILNSLAVLSLMLPCTGKETSGWRAAGNLPYTGRRRECRVT